MSGLLDKFFTHLALDGSGAGVNGEVDAKPDAVAVVAVLLVLLIWK